MDDTRFTPFLTVFQLYQDDERVIIKGCVKWNLFAFGKISASGRSQTRGRQSSLNTGSASIVTFSDNNKNRLKKSQAD